MKQLVTVTLGDRTGWLRVSEAFRIFGVVHGNLSQRALLAEALSARGWQRQSRRVDGTLLFVYVRGDFAGREMEILAPPVIARFVN